MRVHVVTHVDFEGPALVADWAAARGHELSQTLALTEEYPEPADIDFLVVMGGSMAADDVATHPWLLSERHYIAETIESDRPVLGVCLGAQILADVCGGGVRRNVHQEIGWYPLAKTPAGAEDPVLSVIDDGLVAGHWHGDTFDVPASAALALSSDACANQAFSLAEGRIVGLQFHLEWTEASIYDLVEHCAADLDGGPHVMDAAQLLEGVRIHGEDCRRALWRVLDAMTANTEEGAPGR